MFMTIFTDGNVSQMDPGCLKQGRVKLKTQFGLFRRMYMKVDDRGGIMILDKKQRRLKHKIEVDHIVQIVGRSSWKKRLVISTQERTFQIKVPTQEDADQWEQIIKAKLPKYEPPRLKQGFSTVIL